jgi:hypothetical protein
MRKEKNTRLRSSSLQAILHYCEQTGHFYWKECENESVLKLLRNPYILERKVGTRADQNGKIILGGNLYLAHQAAFMIKTGNRPSKVHHLDGDTLNNRWSNLSDVPPSKTPPKPNRFNATITGSKISIKNY